MPSSAERTANKERACRWRWIVGEEAYVQQCKEMTLFLQQSSNCELPPFPKSGQHLPHASLALTTRKLLARQVLDRIAAVRRHRLSARQLRIGIRGVRNLPLGIVHHGEGGEAIAGTELSRPAAADGVTTASDAIEICLSSWVAVDLFHNELV